MASQESDEPLFKDVTYYIVGDIDSEVIDLLNDGGAKKDSYLSEMVSHVIADDCTQSEYSEAKELFELPVVTSDWVRLSVTCKKQLDLTLFSPDEVIFSGVIACCSQLKPDDTNALWAMLTAKGGRCRQTLDKQCTHLITGDKHGAKYEEAIKHGGAIKIVCPDWVTDSLEKKERQDEALYHPNLLKSPTDSATPPSTPPPTVRSSPSEPTPMDIEQQEEHAKQQAKLKLKAQALQQHGRIHQKQEVAVSRTPANQVIAQQLAAAVLEKRLAVEEGSHKARTSASPVTANAKQALALMVSSRLQGTRPRQKSPGRPPQSHMSRSPAAMPPIPHMQIPPLGLPSFLPPEMQRMGMQRPLRNITNKADQPQSIPGMMLSPNKMNQRMPFNAAIPPGHRPPPPRYVPPPMGQSRPPISMPTTYWGHDPSDNLPPEMCLLGCVFYITDYLKIVGQPQIDNWKKVIEQHGGQVDPAYSNRVTHLLCATQHTDVFHIALKDQRRVVTAFWLNDVLVKKKMLPPWQALHLPIIYGETKPCNNQILCVTNFDGEERLRIKQMINAIGAKYTGYMTHGNSAIICGRSDGKKYDKANEWKIPVVNVQWLSDLVLGHLEALKLPVSPKYRFLGHENQFNLDLSKVLHLMVGWQVPLKIQKETWKKFMPNQKARQAQQSQENELHKDISEPAVKKQKLSIEDPTILQNATQPVIIFTGFPKGQVKKFQMIVSQLGGLSTENPRLCTHLVAPSLSRTMKFFIAINVCQHIVTQEWIEACMAQGTFVDETPYKLRDAATEKAMGCVLDDSLMRAQTKKLFEGMSFYISPSVSPPLSDLKKIVEAAGGKVLKQRPNLLTFTEHKDENGNMKTVMITCENDVMLYKDLIAKDIAIYNAEFILTGVMRQTVDFKVFQIDVH